MTAHPDGQERMVEAQQKTIQTLREELRWTSSELLQLTLEMEDRVAECTAELQAANGKHQEEAERWGVSILCPRQRLRCAGSAKSEGKEESR